MSIEDFVKEFSTLPDIVKDALKLRLSIEVCNKVFEIVERENPDIIERAVKEVLEIS